MIHVVHLVKRLEKPPTSVVVPHVRLHTFASDWDVDHWLSLREQSGLFCESAQRRWGRRDFQREFLEKRWWHPKRMWFAEATEAIGTRQPVIGTITLGRCGPVDSEQPMVHWLMVARPWRRRGVGHQLLLTLERECWRLGYRQLRVETLRSWAEAMAFYSAMGFCRT